MSKKHREAVQKQFARTVEHFSKLAVRDTPEVVAEKVQFAKPQPSDLVLDVGCGVGTLLLALAPRVRFARGIDLTPPMLRRARAFQLEHGIPNLCFDCGDAEQLPYPDGTFDLVICECTVHHLERPERALREMVRVARPDGRVVVIDSLAPESDAKFELHNQIECLRDRSHTRSLRLTTFLALFEQLGLEIVRQTQKRRERSFNQWMLRAGLQPHHKRYRQVRQMMEDSIVGDRAGFSPQPQGDDLRIVHIEGMFLLTRRTENPP